MKSEYDDYDNDFEGFESSDKEINKNKAPIKEVSVKADSFKNLSKKSEVVIPPKDLFIKPKPMLSKPISANSSPQDSVAKSIKATPVITKPLVTKAPVYIEKKEKGTP